MFKGIPVFITYVFPVTTHYHCCDNNAAAAYLLRFQPQWLNASSTLSYVMSRQRNQLPPSSGSMTETSVSSETTINFYHTLSLSQKKYFFSCTYVICEKIAYARLYVSLLELMHEITKLCIFL